MKSDETIERIKDSEELALRTACDALRGHFDCVRDNVLLLVASICNVDEDEILSYSRKPEISQARWFYWYVLKRLFNESYDGIIRKSDKQHRFTSVCVGVGISKISKIIDKGGVWAKRWSILKRVVDCARHVEDIQSEQKKVTVRITHPIGVNVELKQEKTK